MKQTIKQYQSCVTIIDSIDKAEDFNSSLGKIINGYQEEGLLVEVQYQATQGRITVVVLAYKNVQVEEETR